MIDELNVNKYEENLETVLPDLIKSYNEESLIFFIGAGCSRIQGYPNWDEYIDGLISYWMSNLGGLIDENSKYKKVELQDINILRNLKNSPIERKRKIDIVHQVIEKYCEQEVSNPEEKKEKEKEKFCENALNYEKYIFIDVEPEKKVNPVLNELVKLNSLFITTNYDNQIELHSKTKKQGMSIYNRIDLVPKIIEKSSVIHLHGTPDIDDPKYFINSSSTYSSLYLNSQSELTNVITLLRNKENASIIFIGCSMDEEEVLALLDRADDSKAKYYAFLTEHTDFNFQNVEEKFFREKRNIKVVRYGDTYDKLPNFVKCFVDKLVQQTSKDTESDWRAIFGE
ncbi:hypothetical protein A9490_27850 [Bacillus thuringiensis]|uniref:SIR2 family protein n=1 Tax=Bacillus thuringiensis TaxID=1428 RepID=UPI0008FDF72B|nr:SIR2 family protein [Bacillus thuringiensis]OJE28337.1 hypothetical protein A9490_27850 [Bacillus thuringiensis]